MAQQITMGSLEYLVDAINHDTKSPKEPYVKNSEGKLIAQVGNYHIDSAYGGWKLVRMESEGGGIDDVFRNGYMTKRELYDMMRAFLIGMGKHY